MEITIGDCSIRFENDSDLGDHSAWLSINLCPLATPE